MIQELEQTTTESILKYYIPVSFNEDELFVLVEFVCVTVVLGLPKSWTTTIALFCPKPFKTAVPTSL